MNLLEEMLKPKVVQQQQADPNAGLSLMLQFLSNGMQNGGQQHHPQQPLPDTTVHMAPLPSGEVQMPQMPSGLDWMKAAQDDPLARLKAQRQMQQDDADQLATVAEAYLGPRPEDPEKAAIYDNELRGLVSKNPALQTLALKNQDDVVQKMADKEYGGKVTFRDYLNYTPDEQKLYQGFQHSPGVVVQTGDRGASDVVWMTPEQKVSAGLDPKQPIAINQKSGMPELIKPNDFSEAQNQAAGFYNRMTAAEENISKEMENGFETGTPKEAIANVLPYGIGGMLRTPAMQRMRQAQEDWVRAKLRKESGAAIPVEEMDREIQTYFPGLNEKDSSIIEQKRQSRTKALEQINQSTGNKPLDNSNLILNSLPPPTKDNKVPPQILDAVKHVESGGNNNAVSPAGAKGPYQFMDDTWSQWGHGGNVNDPNDSRASAEDYLSHLYNTFGSWDKALAAYNGGPSRLSSKGGDISKMPQETQNYVPKVANTINAKDTVNGDIVAARRTADRLRAKTMTKEQILQELEKGYGK
jgi:soluble lytic murein transglycosylase-like protein